MSSDSQNGDPAPLRALRAGDSDRVELGTLLRGLWSRRILIGISTLIGAALFYILVSGVTPLYSARASLLLDPRSVQVLTSDSVVSDLNLSSPVIETEAAVLRSNMLLERVVTELGPAALAGLDPTSGPDGPLDRLRATLRLDGGDAEIAELTADDPQMRRLIAGLRRAVSVQREGQSYLIGVTAQTPDPALSQLVANTVVETYIQSQIEQRNAVIRGATAFLVERIEQMERDVEIAEQRIENFRSQQVSETGASQETIERQLSELTTQQALAQADLAQVRSRYDQIQTVIDTGGIGRAAELLSSPYVLSLRQQISEANGRDAELATQLPETHPQRRAIRAELDQLNGELAQEVQLILANLGNDATVAEARVASISGSVEAVEEQAVAFSRANVELRQLEREADAIRATYQDLLNRLSETRANEELQRADARQVERALLPQIPSSPRTKLFTAFGAALGFSIGLVLTFYLAVARPGYSTTEQIEDDLGLPVNIALLKLKLRNTSGLVQFLIDTPFSPYVERLRQLRTVIEARHSRADRGICVQLTSSVASESKTSTTIALGFLEARAGRRCLVLDFDLRRSSLSRELRYTADHDLADVLAGRCALSDAIGHVEELGFDILTLKRPAPYLGDQLDTEAVRQILDALRDSYHIVLVDSAPVLFVSESQRLAPLMDEILFLVRQNFTKPAAVRQAMRKLAEVGAPTMTLAMTVTDPNSEQETYGAYGSYDYG